MFSDKISEHFQNQGNPNIFNQDFQSNIQKLLLEGEKNLKYNTETDKVITYKELKNVISQLKTGKAAGPDRILNEVIKYSYPVLSNSLLKIFNLILKAGKYPAGWKKSFIVAIYKSGDRNDPNNYRGISLSNCLTKIFNAILNNRLTNIVNSRLSKNQFGFRENHRTSDSIFILKSLINKYIHKDKKKLYICFVDLRKAFDSVWREGLMFKLMKTGVGKQFYNIVKEQYEKTESSIKYDNLSSEYFSISRGVKQGDSLSPTLFNIFIDDIVKELENNESDPVTLVSSKFNSLLFADDLMMISESKDGLQKNLNVLSDFCDNWQLGVNVKKTKTMIIKQNCTKDVSSFVTYKGIPISGTIEYKFLGILLKNNGNFSCSTLELTKRAKKVLFAMKSYTSSLCNLPVTVANNLFDSMVKPIALYNSEVTFLDTYVTYYRAKKRAEISGKQLDKFHFIDKTPMEKLHLQYCKYLLGVRKSSSNLAVRADLGRLPLELYIKFYSILYFIRLHSEEINPLLKESFLLTKNLNDTGVYSWYTYIKDILEELNIDLDTIKEYSLGKMTNVKRDKIKSEIKYFYENLFKKKMTNIDDTSKLNMYKTLKQPCDIFEEFYLSCKNFEYRKLITKYRISDHNLFIEKGRYLKIPREERLCKKCKKLEDETHFLLYCDLNNGIRKHYFEFLKNENENFSSFSDLDKTNYILNPKTFNQVNKLGSFLKQSTELRTGDS